MNLKIPLLIPTIVRTVSGGNSYKLPPPTEGEIFRRNKVVMNLENYDICIHNATLYIKPWNPL